MRPALDVAPGPWLLRSPAPDLATHRRTHGELPEVSLDALLAVLDSVVLRGRGGAGFPFGIKLRTTAGRRGRKHVVVNLSEGEPASLKDLALSLTQPHLVLDGAAVTARVLGVHKIHLVLPAEHPQAQASIERALAERGELDGRGRLRWEVHHAARRFVSGEASAVTELIDGRVGLPVTSWEPTALAGVGGRPTMLSNAETFANVATLALHGAEAYCRQGTTDEPGTRLLTLGADSGSPRVVEVPHGTPWREVLSEDEMSAPVLLGGYHGTWAAEGELAGHTVSATALKEAGLTIGAGVVLPLPFGACPLERTARIVSYLASESAGRCGPCFNGLPALATAFQQVVDGVPGPGVEELTRMVEGRGACAHPDGTIRLVRSTMRSFGLEIAAHAHGVCLVSRRNAEAV